MPITKVPLAGLADDVQEKLNVTNTLSGTFKAANVRSSRTSENARDTGFQNANGVDIGEADRSTQYYDDHATNCNGYLPNGNCAGDSRCARPTAIGGSGVCRVFRQVIALTGVAMTVLGVRLRAFMP